MLTKIKDRYYELYEEAVTRMLNKTDFDATEWLDEDEEKEFLQLQDEISNS